MISRRTLFSVCAVAFSAALMSLAPVVALGDEQLAESWRFSDGVPDSILYEEQELAAFEDVAVVDGEIADFARSVYNDTPDGYYTTWNGSDGVGWYECRKDPKDSFTYVEVPGAKEVGVDISYFNNNQNPGSPIDWNAMRADGITFAIIRLGDGGSSGTPFYDPWFVRNVQGAKAAGIKVGAYVYSRARSIEGNTYSVTNEVDETLTQLSSAGLTGDNMDLPVYLDMEDSAQRKLGANAIANIATAWCDSLQAKGFRVGIYANQDWYKNVLTADIFKADTMKENGWSRWAARYAFGATSSGVDGTQIWQFTSTGIVDGTPRKYCDVNFSFIDTSEMGKGRRTYWVKEGSEWYLRGPDGMNLTGWQQVSGKWYYLQSNGVMLRGWQLIDGEWYYLNSDGSMHTGWLKKGKTWYYLASSGAMATHWVKADDGRWYFFKESGAMQSNGWKKIDGVWYYLEKSGAMRTGWMQSKGKWYYLKPSGAMGTGWQKVNDTWYLMNSSGAMKTGWQKIRGVWYHLKGSGAMTTGWLKSDGHWYYLKPSSGAMVAACSYEIDGKTYVFRGNGALK